MEVARNCSPCTRSFDHSPTARISSPAAIDATWPTTVSTSRRPGSVMRSTQKPVSGLWNVTRSTVPSIDPGSLPCGGGRLAFLRAWKRNLSPFPRDASPPRSGRRRFAGRSPMENLQCHRQVPILSSSGFRGRMTGEGGQAGLKPRPTFTCHCRSEYPSWPLPRCWARLPPWRRWRCRPGRRPCTTSARGPACRPRRCCPRTRPAWPTHRVTRRSTSSRARNPAAPCSSRAARTATRSPASWPPSCSSSMPRC